MPLPEQTYIPVPGFEQLSRDYERYNTGLEGSKSTSASRNLRPQPTSSSSGNRLSRASLTQPYSDYSDPYPTPSPELNADYSYKDLPPAPIPTPSETPGEMPMSMAPGASMASRGNSEAYQNIPSESYYPQQTTAFTATPRRSNKKWWVIGAIGLGIAAVIAIIVGVVVSQVHKNSSKGSSSKDTSTSKSGNNGGTLSDPNDPSNFVKDSRLHQSFWGFAYTPNDTQPPWCGATQTNVTKDIQLLSQLTTRLRLYGSLCNTTALVLQAIQDTKTNLTVWPAIYVDSNETAYEAQVTALSDALTTYGVNNVEGVIVGNEYILNTAGSSTNTSASYLTAVETITSKVADVKSKLSALSLSKTLQIGTADAGSILSTTLAEGIDFYMANVHPYFGSVAIQDAATWTTEFFGNFDTSVAATASNQPSSYIAETGWPTQSMDKKDASDGAGSPQGDASVANLQTFLDTFVCQATANGSAYFYFEAFDEPWKAQFGGVEPYWGLFDSDRNLKKITIPQC